MQTPQNTFKRRLLAGELQIGLWCSLGSNIAAEIIGDAGFDWVLLDTEHAPNEPPDVLAQLQAFAVGTAQVVVRPAWNDAVLIKRLLDIGAQTLLIPFVQNAEEARRAVAACRYPPAGIRGITTGGRAARFGRATSYLKEADQQVCVLVQAETLGAIDRIPEIAAVDGVDGIFVGPSDLSASMGHIGNPLHPDVQRAIEVAARRIHDAGKVSGILTPVEADARRYIEWGYRFAAVGTDIGLLAKSTDALAAAFRKK
ncbi:HpcH/HpaI aldolase/citrate lyase family protein [Bradyrhizobium sp. NP1]|uniref:HpcH/HpaI aldolase family protein n=1 Tax=Bradyrhizobium sp. NP1 TaxID=3049772 RepID=UPI0025A674E7|nr:HpcH/HpaI aldolase/citrate lyase family protein [Bradyrhizobium sp. NP1]WJR76591.1 HpcH/HpaI aldolase/citrate lyase family protein [Bradyrhizobium sp. NP1]